MKNSKLHCILSLGFAFSVVAAIAQAQTYTPVHKYGPWGTDGCCQGNPGLLAEGLDGKIYGTNPSQVGGYGTLISYSPATGIFSTPINFQGGANGNSPLSGWTLGFDGNLYGATEWGGQTTTSTGAHFSGYGTVVKFTPGVSAYPTGIYPFTNGSDGAYPWAPPVQTPDGSLWGVTNSGGTIAGTVYKLTSSGALSWFGKLPSNTAAPLILSQQQGNLYGTTQYGDDGTSAHKFNRGTVFKLTQTGVITVLYSFNPNDPKEGLVPVGPVLEGYDGFLYGTTSTGGQNATGLAAGTNDGRGTIFRIARDGSSFSTIHAFQDNVTAKEGYGSVAGLVQGSDYRLYGVNPNGGANGYGTLFSVNTDGTNFAVLYNFDKPSGSNPSSTPFLHTNGKIYGTTAGGGSGYGVLYSFDAGLKPFAILVGPWSGPVGTVVGILGQGFTNVTGVLVGGAAVPWTKFNGVTIVSDTYMTVTIPAGAKNGPITIEEPSGNLVTPQIFSVTCTSIFCRPILIH